MSHIPACLRLIGGLALALAWLAEDSALQATGTKALLEQGAGRAALPEAALVRLGTVQSLAGEALQAIAFAPDGKILAAAGADRLIHLWDPATGQKLGSLRGHRGEVLSVAFAPDGKTLASAGDDGDVRLWDVASGKQLHCFKAHQSRVPAVVFSPDGKLLASGSWDSTICLRDTATGKVVRRFGRPALQVEALAFSPDGTLLASGDYVLRSHDTISLWDTASGKEVRHFGREQRGTGALAFSPDGKTLASGNDDAGVHLWVVADGRKRGTFLGHQGYVKAVAFSPDGKMLGSAVFGGRDQTARLWEVASSQERCRLVGHLRYAPHIAFSPDGRTVATGGEDGTALIWDVTRLATGRRTQRDLAPTEVESVWTDLAGTDAARAFRAIGLLTAAPQQAMPFLREQLRKEPRVPPERIRQLMAELDSDRYAMREKAREELERLGEIAEPYLRRVLTERPTLEVRRRVERLLEKVGQPIPPEQLRPLRAVEVLEHIGTPEGRAVLATLAEGAPEARLTQDAKAALERLAKKSAARP
jgi:dipeptidyl aminopeptidase/acylaminoacyl peptidase